jgi:hypothetical protein
MSTKDAAALLRREFATAYQEPRPPGTFPINAAVLASQVATQHRTRREECPVPPCAAAITLVPVPVLCDVCVRLGRVAEQVCQVCGPQSSTSLAHPLLAAQVPQVFGVVRSGSTPIAVRLVAATSLDALGAAAAAGAGGERGAREGGGEVTSWRGAGSGVSSSAAAPEDPHAAAPAPSARAPHAHALAAQPPPLVVAAQVAAPPAPRTDPAVAAKAAAELAENPARALATALAPSVPPDALSEPHRLIISQPYSAPHVRALAHCLACPQVRGGAPRRCSPSAPPGPPAALLAAPAAPAPAPLFALHPPCYLGQRFPC